jgi:hypothetical protein
MSDSSAPTLAASSVYEIDPFEGIESKTPHFMKQRVAQSSAIYVGFSFVHLIGKFIVQRLIDPTIVLPEVW